MVGGRIAVIGAGLLLLSVGYPVVALRFGSPDVVLLAIAAGFFSVAGLSLLVQGIRLRRRDGMGAASAFRDEIQSNEQVEE